jgi:hypothetical protein
LDAVLKLTDCSHWLHKGCLEVRLPSVFFLSVFSIAHLSSFISNGCGVQARVPSAAKLSKDLGDRTITHTTTITTTAMGMIQTSLGRAEGEMRAEMVGVAVWGEAVAEVGGEEQEFGRRRGGMVSFD